MRSGTIPRINGERLLQRLHDLAQIGATPGGGVTRLALSDEDRAGRDLLAIVDVRSRARAAHRRCGEHDRLSHRAEPTDRRC